MIDLTDKKYCCGCTACYSICTHSAIMMARDEEGFSYPVINLEKCVGCGLCEQVCPMITVIPEGQQNQPIIYAAVNKNEEIYLSSSSGGIFFSLCEYIIHNKGIVYGAIFDDNFHVKHAAATTIEGCRKFQGSKYTQSDIREIFPKIKSELKSNIPVLFSGTPCQVSGLKNYLRKPYNNLYTCDLVCHGVPSPLLFKEYLTLISKGKRIKSIAMKSKRPYEKGTAINIEFIQGKNIRRTLETDIWNTLYFNHYALRPSCHICPFTNFNRTGDITIGDFWNFEKVRPDFHTNQCISLVMINSRKGQYLFDQIRMKLDIELSNSKECTQHQLQYPAPISPLRDIFWKDYHAFGFPFVSRKYLGYTYKARIKQSVKRLFK